MQFEGDFNAKKYALLVIVGSLMTSAVIGALVFIFGSFGSLEFKIIATILSLGFFSLLGLSTAIWYKTERQMISYIGTAMAIAGFVSTEAMLFHRELLGNEMLIRLLVPNNVLLTGLGISSILLTVEGKDKLVRKFRSTSIVLTAFTAVGLSLLWLGGFSGSPTRVLGATAILGTATTISTFVLNRIRNE